MTSQVTTFSNRYAEFVAEPARPGYAIPKMNYMPYPEQLLAEMKALLSPDSSYNDEY